MSQLKINILVVEDNLQDFIIIKEVLGQIRGFFLSVDHAATMEEALNKINASDDHQHYDIIFLDLFLPDSYGQETFKMVESSLDIAPPIVVLSGLSDKNIATEIVKAGAQDYLVKGDFDSNLLEKTILYSIERKKYQDSLRFSEMKYRSTVESVPLGIGEYDYSEVCKYIQDLKKSGHPGPSVQPLITDENVTLLRSLFKRLAMNKKGLEFFACKDIREFQDKAVDIEIVNTLEYFNEISAAIWDELPLVETQITYKIGGKKVESLKLIRFMGDEFGYKRMITSTIDVTKLKKTERAVDKQTRVLHMIATTSSLLLEANSYEQVSSRIIAHLGTGFKANSVCSMSCDMENMVLRLDDSWSSQGVDACTHEIKMTLEFSERFGALLRSGATVQLTDELIERENIPLAKELV
ncbi:MAG: response regulator, partial [Flavobacteriales bacterium]|nr:response regulator [Flavobacteriales bacterium]